MAVVHKTINHLGWERLSKFNLFKFLVNHIAWSKEGWEHLPDQYVIGEGYKPYENASRVAKRDKTAPHKLKNTTYQGTGTQLKFISMGEDKKRLS